MSSPQTHLPTCYRHPDRETGLSCSECGRPICTECMTVAPVGLRCPDHSGVRRTPKIKPRPVIRAPGARLGTSQAPITKALIAINVAIYLITVVQPGSHGLNSPGGSLYDKAGLYGPYVAHGDWWRLVTAMFLHGFLLHIVFNMYALWAIGTPVEQYLGPVRYIGLYFVSGLAGSAGALVNTPTAYVVGASGAIFGVLGAMMIIEWQVTGRLAGQAMTLIVINLGLNFVLNGAGGNISIGGHIGGLIGGVLVMLSFAHWGRRGQGQAAYGKLGPTGVAGLVVVAVASIAIAYWKVRGLA